MDNGTTGAAWINLLYWKAVFGANLVVPIGFGVRETADGGRVGMYLGIAFLWLGSALAVSKLNGIPFNLLSGGMIVALSQVFPILQVLAGIPAIGLVRRIGQGLPDESAPNLLERLAGIQVGHHTHGLTELGGFLATLVTGGAPLLIAIVLGTAYRALFASRAESRGI